MTPRCVSVCYLCSVAPSIRQTLCVLPHSLSGYWGDKQVNTFTPQLLSLLSHHPLCSALPNPSSLSISRSFLWLLLVHSFSISSIPVVPRWVTSCLPGVPVHYGSCSPDCGWGSVALTCSFASTACQATGWSRRWLLLVPDTSSLALFLSFYLSLSLSLSLREFLASLPPSLFSLVPSYFRAFSVFTWTVLTSPFWFALLSPSPFSFFLWGKGHSLEWQALQPHVQQWRKYSIKKKYVNTSL